MSVSGPVALLCVTLFCALVDTAQSQLGYCDEGGCWIGYRESTTYRRGALRCKMLGGLMIPISEGFENTPFGLKSDTGLDWRLMLHMSNGSKDCIAVSKKTPSGTASISAKDCGEKLEAVICYFGVKDPCRPLQVDKDLKVQYRDEVRGFEFVNTKTVPTGTWTRTRKDGAEYPESKFLCASGKWLKAPWSCDTRQGGCEHNCKQENQNSTCVCPAGTPLHANGFTCACKAGYRLGRDEKSCVDVDECAENAQLCRKEENKQCWNTDGSYECACRDGFDIEAGVCVNVSICDRCEHLRCNKTDGVFACQCREGYAVSTINPVKCVRECGESCWAECIHNPDVVQQDLQPCFCPRGYIKHIGNNGTLCVDIDECENGDCDSQLCENTPGKYRCFCAEGFELHWKNGKKGCKPIMKEGEKVEGQDGLVSHPSSTWGASQGGDLPQYIRTGSILGISVFLLLCVLCVSFTVWRFFRRHSRFTLPPLSNQDINVFYLQQVTTGTYKRLS